MLTSHSGHCCHRLSAQSTAFGTPAAAAFLSSTRRAGPLRSRQASRRQLLTVSAAFLGLQLPKLGGGANIGELKRQLLDAIGPLQRGAAASEQDKQEVERLIRRLEGANPTPASLSSPLINGKWQLVYTTSSSILGSTRPAALRPAGPIFQFLDAPAGKGRNQETWPFFNSVKADLTPVSKSRVDVQFTQFKIVGLVPVTAPASARGWLDTTFLDEDMRISRGDKGNVFVLLMEDPNAKP